MWIEIDKKPGICFIHTNLKYKFTSSKTIIKKWKIALRKIALINDFNQRYKIKKFIGKGSFAKVYLAILKETGKKYAVKRFERAKLFENYTYIHHLWDEISTMR